MHRRIVPDVLPADGPPATVAADASLQAAATEMAARDVDALTVVDGAGAFVGLLTAGDLVRRGFAKMDTAGKRTVADVMTARPDTVAPGDTAFDAFALMRGRGIDHVAVVADGRPLGVLSMRDLSDALESAVTAQEAAAEAAVFSA